MIDYGTICPKCGSNRVFQKYFVITDVILECKKCGNTFVPDDGKIPIMTEVKTEEKNGGVIVTGKLNPNYALKDSGARREFETGAVRDISEGKGRCDLLPLDVVGNILKAPVLNNIERFKETKDVRYLIEAFAMFANGNSTQALTRILEVSKHFEAGAEKYGENNWKKGIPLHCYIDSAVRHYLKHLRGDTDGHHDRAFVQNILCAIWTFEHKPELDDIEKDIEEIILSDETKETLEFYGKVREHNKKSCVNFDRKLVKPHFGTSYIPANGCMKVFKYKDCLEATDGTIYMDESVTMTDMDLCKACIDSIGWSDLEDKLCQKKS